MRLDHLLSREHCQGMAVLVVLVFCFLVLGYACGHWTFPAVLVGALSGFGLMGLAGCIGMAVLVVWCSLVGWLLFV